jgi:hypothetical protein
MDWKSLQNFVLAAILGLGLAGSAGGTELDGLVKVGYVLLDEEGNRGVNQPTYNIYEGFSLSFEKLRYVAPNGTRFYGKLKNVTLNNRNIYAGVTKCGVYGLTISNNQYRRTYSFDGSQFTRRHRTNGQMWLQPHENIRLFGGYGVTGRKGRIANLFERAGVLPIRPVDYNQHYFNAGIRLTYDRRVAEFEYRDSDYTDALDNINDRNSRRFRVAAATPLPLRDNILINGGYQHYQNRLTNRRDTLTANTTWGGVRFYHDQGYSLKYSFIFDRARRTGDLAATDNMSHSLYVGRTWSGRGGVTVGYRYQTNDGVPDEVSTNGYFLSGWARLSSVMSVKAGLGSERKEVQEGRTLTGDRDYDRYWASLRYRLRPCHTLRIKVEDKKTDNDDIGSSADFTRFSADLTSNSDIYDNLQVSYDYLTGDYENSDGSFTFGDHVVNGDLYTKEYRQFRAGIGGTYRKSTQDLDVESFSVRLTGVYSFMTDYELEVAYSAHNFDDLADPSPVYSRYYTANVVQVSLSRVF